MLLIFIILFVVPVSAALILIVREGPGRSPQGD